MSSMRDDVPVITGLGVIAPNGIGTEEYWAATLSGKNGIDRITAFDPSGYSTTLAGSVTEFVGAENVRGKLVVQTDRWTQFGLAATALALDDARLDPKTLPTYGVGVVTAASSGGNEFGQREIERLGKIGPEAVTVYQSIAWFYAASTGQVAIANGARGRCSVLVAEQAGGLDALGQARRMLREDGGAVICGGTEAPLSPYALVCQIKGGGLSAATDPEAAYLPFDSRAAGHVPGEGGAMMIIETAALARERGATPYGLIAGYAAGFDPRPGSGRPPVLARIITAALADAGLTSGDVDVVFADAAGARERDLQESAAIAQVFGPHAVPVTAPKTMTGRLYAGAGAVDTAAALLSIRDGVIPPTTGTRELAPGHAIDLVLGEPREAPLRTALVIGRGHGGFTSVLIVQAA
jgi:act minimal PKS chain-length factor (CLF/KS beta)